ncbi:hypothetical protein TanjilG_29734 [Lupinus angustifolius]|uniref:Avr9/Cf-9 rapidly elicited protein 146 n=1 Tax=Lupinus angustifolius TaxID=3871 RepID=A0A1J7HT97_LUPAN|nr:PREDICTED: uncharacterized protein LOC109357859 [Lupinus angustifolius]OIW03699.1 hypothetical protein TanjilG_29734 [Lupinus angustifolius]
MEIEQSTHVGAKKLWKILRIMFMMLRKGIAKSKIMVDFNLLLKRGKLAAGKVIANTSILHHHYFAAFTCRRSNLSFISPRDYEFSCSNSPALSLHKHNRRHNRSLGWFSTPCQQNEVSTMDAVQKVFEMLNNENTVEASPLVALPGFGKSPIGRQLRITDSPFPLKDEGDHGQVDMEAEEFIKRFYKELNLQQKMSAIESPYHNLWNR